MLYAHADLLAMQKFPLFASHNNAEFLTVAFPTPAPRFALWDFATGVNILPLTGPQYTDLIQPTAAAVGAIAACNSSDAAGRATL